MISIWFTAIYKKEGPVAAGLKNKFPVNTNEHQETVDILFALARGEEHLDKKGVASATQKKIKNINSNEAKKSESHDGRSKKLGKEFAMADRDEDDDIGDYETSAKKKS